MATSFPTGLDTFTDPNSTAGDTLASVPHDAQHDNANDAIAALEAKVGVNGSGVTSSLDYKVAHIASQTFATPAIVLGTAAAAGAATTGIRSDSTIVAFDATVPSTSSPGDAAAAGTAAVASRRDHVHAREAATAFATPAIALGTAAAAGSATTVIRSDSTIVAFDATVPSTSSPGDAAAVGSATVAARRDHVHAREAATATATSQSGTSYTLALTDAQTVVEFTAATAVAVTVPLNASVAFPLGTVIELAQIGAGQITVGGSATLQSNGAKVKTAAQYSSIGLRKRATDTWQLTGDLA